MVQEAGVLMGEAVVVLLPYVGGQNIVQGGDVVPPGQLAAHLQPLGVLGEHATNREVDRIHGNSNTVSQYKLYTMEMVGAFYRFCENNFIDFNDFLGEMSNPYEKVPKMDESTLKKWIVQVSTEMGKQLKSVRNSKSRRLINDAKNIVANRYMEEDLSLDKVCSIMGVSNSYFSSIFKKETGISFVSYLTDYRMDIAAKLILDTNEKSYKIGEMVGYMDANYFSYVFKKKFGISP